MDIQREEFEKYMKDNHPFINSKSDAYLAMWNIWQASSIPEGFVVVPKEPPEGMDFKICDMVNHRIDIFEADRIYKAMIEAVEKDNGSK